MRAAQLVVVALAVSGCMQANFTSSDTTSRQDTCLTDAVCTPSGGGASELIALVSVASLVSVATVLRYVR